MKRSLVFSLCLLALLSFGCAVPWNLPYVPNAQHQLQSVKHWTVVGGDVADKVSLALANSENANQPVYVEKPNQTKFEEAFYEILLTKLSDKGIAISPGKAQALVLDYDAKVIVHRAYRGTPSHSEVLVTSGLWRGSNILTHLTDSFYIQDRDRWHYLSTEMPAPYAKTYQTKSK